MNNTTSEFQTGSLKETGASFEKELSKAYSAQSAALVDALSALTVRIKAGDSAAFEIFYDTSKNYVYNNIRGLSSSLSDETAQDIMQEVYIKAFSNISSLNDPKGTLKWLKTITINTTRDYFKKSSVRHESLIKEDEEGSFESSVSESELMEPIEIPENIVEDSATRKIVADAVMALPEKQRMLMSEFYYNGRSIKDIAAESGMSEGAVKAQLSRARSSLKNTFLKIEKDQGIRLHSVGIIPFIFFIFYLLMQQNPVKEAVGSAVRVSVFNSELFKNAAGSALEAASQAAQGLYKGQVTDAASKSAKGAADSAKELARSAQSLNAANASGKAPGVSPETASNTGKETAKAAKAASKASKAAAKASSAKAAGTAAGAAAKTAGLSAAAKGIIIGAAAAVAIGATATTAVVVKNNNETEIIAEAESETETEETTAEITEETTEIVDETTLMYQLYYDKILELQDEYGEATVEAWVEDAGDWDDYYFETSGLCCAQLIDFDGDGTEELLVAYDEEIDVCEYILDGEEFTKTFGYTVEIYAYNDGAIESVYKSGPEWNADGGAYYVNILYGSEKCYIVDGIFGYNGWGYQSYEFENGQFQVASYTGSLVQEVYGFEDVDVQHEAYEQWLEDIGYTSSYTLYLYEYIYGAVSTPAESTEEWSSAEVDPADCEDTITYLKLKLGLIEAIEPEEVFSQIAGEFTFVGGDWATSFILTSDGTIESGETIHSVGYYENSEYTEYCYYTASLTDIIQTGDYSYSAKMTDMTYYDVDGDTYTEEFIEGDYQYIKAPGLENADKILIFLPGTDVSETVLADTYLISEAYDENGILLRAVIYSVYDDFWFVYAE